MNHTASGLPRPDRTKRRGAGTRHTTNRNTLLLKSFCVKRKKGGKSCWWTRINRLHLFRDYNTKCRETGLNMEITMKTENHLHTGFMIENTNKVWTVTALNQLYWKWQPAQVLIPISSRLHGESLHPLNELLSVFYDTPQHRWIY